MKKIIYFFGIFLLCLSTTPASAEWKKVDTYDEGTIYLDSDRIREKNGEVYFWFLTDFDKPKGGFLSATFYAKADCEIMRWKQLGVYFYRAPMGEEFGSKSEEPSEWRNAQPNSMVEVLLHRACFMNELKNK